MHQGLLPDEDVIYRDPPPSPLVNLPISILWSVARLLPVNSRTTLRLACRLLSAALSNVSDAVCIDAAAFASGGAAAAASLIRTCPHAQLAVVRLRADAPPPSRDILDLLFSILAASKPQLKALRIEEVWSQLPPFLPRSSSSQARWRSHALIITGAALARAVSTGLASRLRRLELPPAALDGNLTLDLDAASGSGKGTSDDGGVMASGKGASDYESDFAWDCVPGGAPIASLRGLSGLQEVIAREGEPDVGVGLSRGGLRELASISGLVALSIDLDSRDAMQAWSAIVVDLPASPAGPHLTELHLGCAGPGEIELPSSWLLQMRRLRHLDCARGVTMDLSGIHASLAASPVTLPGDGGTCDISGWGAHHTADQDSQSYSNHTSNSLTSFHHHNSSCCGRGRSSSRGGGGGDGSSALSLPPLEHLALSQPRLGAAGWCALADGALLGAKLTSLELWRCGAPPPGLLRQLRARSSSSSCTSSLGGAAPGGFGPFPALVRLHLGTSGDPSDAVEAAAQLIHLRCLSLHHAGSAARRGFGADDPGRLMALTELTRLVMMPVYTGYHVRWSLSQEPRVPWTPEEAALLAALPRLAFYDGPIPGCDPVRGQAWSGSSQARW